MTVQFRALASSILHPAFSGLMLVFSILPSIAVLWRLWSSLMTLLFDYHMLFLLRFSLVFLITPSCRCVQAIPTVLVQYALPHLYHYINGRFNYFSQFFIVLLSVLAHLLFWIFSFQGVRMLRCQVFWMKFTCIFFRLTGKIFLCVLTS